MQFRLSKFFWGGSLLLPTSVLTEPFQASHTWHQLLVQKNTVTLQTLFMQQMEFMNKNLTIFSTVRRRRQHSIGAA